MEERAKYIYTVELIDGEKYTYNESRFLTGKVKVSRKYSFDFDYSDYTEKKKDTFFDLVDSLKCDKEGVWAETYAVSSYNTHLFYNICKYKGKSPSDYQKDFKHFQRHADRGILPVNAYREQLKSGLQNIENVCSLLKYIEINRKKFLDESEMLYKRNDNVKNVYPYNFAGRSVSLSLYDGLLFNSSLPYYYLYRNYKYAVQALSELFYKNITEGEDKRIEECFMRQGGCREKHNTKLYGLYFPLLMLFRQSIELAFKLVFVNEVLKNQNYASNSELKKQIAKIKTHDLLKLLELLEKNLDPDEYEYLWKLSSFIYYNEDMDPAFSRYLINSKFELEHFKDIRVWYVDIHNYVNEFYPVMDNIIERIQMGFDPDEIF